MHSKKKVTIIGLGLSGSVMAIYLAKRGYQVEGYEKRPHLRFGLLKNDGVRSCNLDISYRGMLALSEIGIDQEILSQSIPMKEKIIHFPNKTVVLPFGREGEYINTIAHSQLHQTIIQAAESYSNIKMHFNQQLTGINFESCSANFLDASKKKNYTRDFDLIIGCDGVNSEVRRHLEKETQSLFEKKIFNHQYKEIIIPISRSHALKTEATHIWPRDNSLIVAHPNIDGSFTATIFLPEKGNASFQQLNSSEKISLFFEEYFFDFFQLVPDLATQFLNKPQGSFFSISEGQWSSQNKVLLVGDSAHAMTPFFGQGMNSCLEDCFLLNKYLDKFYDNWDQAIFEFESNRKVDTNAINKMSLENYPGLAISDWENYVAQKQIEILLKNRFDDFVSHQHFVCFTNIPYRYALAIKNFEQKLINKILDENYSKSECDSLRKAMNIYQKEIAIYFHEMQFNA